MKCPHCNISLLMAEKQGVEIDYCPDCRGIWLDRGELEKIIEKSTSTSSYTEPQRTPSYNDDRHYDKHDKHGYNNNNDGHFGNKRNQRGNFLADLFDFGG